MELVELFERHEHDDERTQAARRMMADVTRFARSIGVQIRFRYPAFHAPEIEVTDLNAKVLGAGAGTQVMNYLSTAADEAQFNIYIAPATPRNKEFYARFGYARSDRHPGLLIRYCSYDSEDDE